MKAKIFVVLFLSVLSLTVMGQKKIALLEPRVGDGSSGVSGMERAMVRGELRKAIVNHTGYEAFTRADVDKLMREQSFQRTGMVSDDQIKKIGVMSGADYICVSTLNKTNTEFYLEAYLVNVESAQISNPASQYGELVGGKLANMLPVCQSLAQELLGTIAPVVSKMNKEQPQQQTLVWNKPSPGVNGKGDKDISSDKTSKKKPSKKTKKSIITNDKIGSVMTFPDGTRGVVFYAEGGVGLAVSLNAAQLKWSTIDKRKNAVDVSVIANDEDDDRNFAPGTGADYTNAIVTEMRRGTAPAAEWCVRHGEGWYLPSAAELVCLFKVWNDSKGKELLEAAFNSAGSSSFEGGWYWSSSECGKMEAINVSSGGYTSGEEKVSPQKVRAVRMFNYK